MYTYLLIATNKQGVRLHYRGMSAKEVRSKFLNEYSRKGWLLEIINVAEG